MLALHVGNYQMPIKILRYLKYFFSDFNVYYFTSHESDWENKKDKKHILQHGIATFLSEQR